MTVLVMPELVRKDDSGISFFTDEALFEEVGTRIAFTMRRGGESLDPYKGLNLGTHVGDVEEHVIANRNLALKAAGAPSSIRLICPNQVHGDHICLISTNDRNHLSQAIEEVSEGTDAVVVTCENVCAMLCFADCLPLIIVATTGDFAVVHAGWRGVVARIAEKAAKRLSESSGSHPSTFNAYIGPYIHEECFEVGPDTYSIFARDYAADIDAVCKEGMRVNLGEAVKATLRVCGIRDERVADLGMCTSCNPGDFYSYRAMDGICGRHGALAFRR